MNYIEQEYDNVPNSVTPEMENFFRSCSENGELVPNAAGLFNEIFMRAET
jgi:hypothetical protein